MSIKIPLTQQLKLILAFLLLFILLSSLLMTSDALQNSARLSHLYSPLLLVNSAGLIVLVILIILNVYDNLMQVRQRRAGAKLIVRLIFVFTLLSIIPGILVYYFSIEFLEQRLDSWIDVRLEKALNDALELNRLSLEMQSRAALQQTKQAAQELSDLNNNDAAVLQLHELRERIGAAELALLYDDGRIIGFASSENNQLLPNRPDDSALLQFKQKRFDENPSAPLASAPSEKTESFASSVPENHLLFEQQPVFSIVELLPERGLYIRTIVRCCPNTKNLSMSGRLIYTLFPIAQRLRQLSNSVESIATEYQQVFYLKQPLKHSFIFVLSLVLLVSVLGAIWLAFY